VQENKIEKVKSLTLLASELGISMAALAIAWTLVNPTVTTTILGATKASQLTENLKALDAQKLLTTGVMARIDSILGNKPFLDLA
jgi:aryl-alcohol dehydrogenase-like predicted oxidoreductase